MNSLTATQQERRGPELIDLYLPLQTIPHELEFATGRLHHVRASAEWSEGCRYRARTSAPPRAPTTLRFAPERQHAGRFCYG